MLQVNVISGDVTSQEVDAIITLVNSIGIWFGGVDRAIQNRCGRYYHRQLSVKIDYPEDGATVFDGKVYIAKGEKGKYSFNDVIFVIDDLALSLSTLVFNALEAAQEAGYNKIAMPSMRTGVMTGVVEKTPLETIVAMKRGIVSFQEKYPDSVMTATIAVYNDPSLEKLFQNNI